MGILTVGERLQPTLPGVEEATTPSATSMDLPFEDRAPSDALRVRNERRLRRCRRSRRAAAGSVSWCSATSAAT